MLEVFDGHVGINLRQLLHEPEEDDLLDRCYVVTELPFANLFCMLYQVEEGLGILAEREWCEVRLDKLEEFLARLGRQSKEVLLIELPDDRFPGGNRLSVEE